MRTVSLKSYKKTIILYKNNNHHPTVDTTEGEKHVVRMKVVRREMSTFIAGKLVSYT